MHASVHAWANDTATDITIEVIRASGDRLELTTLVAEPGPLVAMKLQAVMNRAVDKQGTDLLDVIGKLPRNPWLQSWGGREVCPVWELVVHGV